MFAHFRCGGGGAGWSPGEVLFSRTLSCVGLRATTKNETSDVTSTAKHFITPFKGRTTGPAATDWISKTGSLHKRKRSQFDYERIIVIRLLSLLLNYTPTDGAGKKGSKMILENFKSNLNASSSSIINRHYLCEMYKVIYASYYRDDLNSSITWLY